MKFQNRSVQPKGETIDSIDMMQNETQKVLGSRIKREA